MTESVVFPVEWNTSRRVTYPNGTRIFRQGDHLSGVQLLARGLVLLCGTGDGSPRFLGIRGNGQVLDALPAVLHAPQLTTAIAIADCEVLQIGLDEFERLRLSHRGMGGWIQGQLAREAAEYMDRWVAVGPKGTVQGMIWVLLQCFRVGGRTRPDGSIQMAFHLSVTALAEWLNVSRQTASEYLTFLKREGLIDVRSDWFVLPAHSPLQARMAVGNV